MSDYGTATRHEQIHSAQQLLLREMHRVHADRHPTPERDANTEFIINEHLKLRQLQAADASYLALLLIDHNPAISEPTALKAAATIIAGGK